MLALWVCEAASDCRWLPMQRFLDEQQCQHAGRVLLLSEGVRYRCMQVMNDVQPPPVIERRQPPSMLMMPRIGSRREGAPDYWH